MNLLAKDHVGRVVESVWLRNDRRAMAFVFADGESIGWEAEGYCCADAWIEAIDDLGFKGPLLEFGHDPDKQDSSTENADFDVLDINFYCAKTERGRLLIELRTSHNGYYGGYLTPREVMEIGEDWKQAAAGEG